MERSNVNAILAHAMELFARHRFHLPPFAHWTPEVWQQKQVAARHAIDSRMGWDLTDFGLGDYAAKGILLFTVRNGLLADLKRGDGLVYCEKIMITRRDQLCPMHRHVMKTEDIINRAGDTPEARLALKLYRTTPEGDLDRQAKVPVMLDGVSHEFAAGETVRLAAGESITLFPGVYHSFWAEGADVMIGEVSTVNDDAADNFFHEPVARFPEIDEDEPPLRLLVSDYAAVFGR